MEGSCKEEEAMVLILGSAGINKTSEVSGATVMGFTYTENGMMLRSLLLKLIDGREVHVLASVLGTGIIFAHHKAEIVFTEVKRGI